MVAAACREDSEGERGDGGLGRAASWLLMEILRGRAAIGDPGIDGGLEVGSVFRSGGMLREKWERCRAGGESYMYTPY